MDKLKDVLLFYIKIYKTILAGKYANKQEK